MLTVFLCPHRQKEIPDKTGAAEETGEQGLLFFGRIYTVSLSKLGGVATRRGAFCAHPYVWRLVGVDPEMALEAYGSCEDVHTPGMIRVSFGIYNTEEEVDELLEILPEAIEAAKEETEKLNSRENVVRMVEPSY